MDIIHKKGVRKLLAPLSLTVAAAIVLAASGSARAQAGAKALTEQQRLDQLSGEVTNLRAQSEDTSSEVKKIEQAITVAPPAEAGAKPATIGQHVGLVEKDLGDLKKDLSDNLGIHVHGLVDANYEYNVNQPNTGGKGGPNAVATGGSTNQLRVFDVNANSFGLEQGNIHIDRTVEGGVGFVTDLNFGQVANVLGSSTRYSNLNPGANATTNTIVDPTQFYATYTVPVGSGINLQAGRFVTLLGEEVIPVYNNLNVNESRSFLFGFAIPFTHTGIRAQYTLNDYIGLTAGINNGWDDVSDNNMGKTVESQIALNNKDKSLSLVLNGLYGPEQVGHSNSKRGVINPVVTWKTPIKGLQLIGDYVFGSEDGPVSVVPAVTSFGNNLLFDPAGPNGSVTINHNVKWQGFAGYIVYDWNDNLEFATRGEYFSDPDGARTGLRENLGEFTQTISYKVPSVNGLLTRFEYRHDESNAKPFFSSDGFNPVTGLPLHTYAGQDTLTAAVIYSF